MAKNKKDEQEVVETVVAGESMHVSFCTREELEELRKDLTAKGFVIVCEHEEDGKIEVTAKNVSAPALPAGKEFVD